MPDPLPTPPDSFPGTGPALVVPAAARLAALVGTRLRAAGIRIPGPVSR